MLRAAIIGATGYTGGELLRWLLRHPQARVTRVTSESSAGRSIFSMQPWGKPRSGDSKSADLILEKCDPSSIARDADVAFLCLPHAESARTGKKFLDKGVKVVDLSADFRLKSASVYQKWYGEKHPCPDLLKSAVYGLPELYRAKIAGASLVANPGCYATTTELSLLPLMKSRLAVPGSIVVDAKSGTSGAGKKLESRYLFCEVNENFLAYGVNHHRHMPEIEQVLSHAAGSAVTLTFVPHLLPAQRGILAACYVTLKKKMTSAQLRKLYADYYHNEPFVEVLPEGQFPELKSVTHTNFCRIGVRVDARHHRAVVLGALDNLGKGASTQAVQNMNLMFGLDERTGLQ